MGDNLLCYQTTPAFPSCAPVAWSDTAAPSNLPSSLDEVGLPLRLPSVSPCIRLCLFPPAAYHPDLPFHLHESTRREFWNEMGGPCRNRSNPRQKMVITLLLLLLLLLLLFVEPGCDQGIRILVLVEASAGGQVPDVAVHAVGRAKGASADASCYTSARIPKVSAIHAPPGPHLHYRI